MQVCMQGGIHPSFTGHTYLQLLGAVKAAAPDIHVHAFSPLEVHQVTGVTLRLFLMCLVVFRCMGTIRGGL